MLLQSLSPPPSSASESFSVHFSRRVQSEYSLEHWLTCERQICKLSCLPSANLWGCLIRSRACPLYKWMHMHTATYRSRSMRMHAWTHRNTQIPGCSQAAEFGCVWILAFPQLGAAGPAPFIRHPSRCQFGLWDQAPRVIRPLPCLPAGPPDGLLSGPRRTKGKHTKKKRKNKTNGTMDTH